MITAVALTLCDQQRSLDVMAALHTSFRNVPGFCSVMNSSLNYIFESVHPYDDVAVRFGKNHYIYHLLINLLNYQSCKRILLEKMF